MKEHETLLDKIEAHRGVFLPNRKEYIDWIFRFNCRFIELHDMNPKDHPMILNKNILRCYTDTFKMCVENYWTTYSPCYLYVPSVECMDELLEYDIKKRGLVLIQ